MRAVPREGRYRTLFVLRSQYVLETILDRPLPDPADPFEMRSGPIWLGRSGDFDPGQSPATALGVALILKGESNHVLDTSLPIAGIDDCWPRADRQPGIELQLGGK